MSLIIVITFTGYHYIFEVLVLVFEKMEQYMACLKGNDFDSENAEAEPQWLYGHFSDSVFLLDATFINNLKIKNSKF